MDQTDMTHMNTRLIYKEPILRPTLFYDVAIELLAIGRVSVNMDNLSHLETRDAEVAAAIGFDPHNLPHLYKNQMTIEYSRRVDPDFIASYHFCIDLIQQCLVRAKVPSSMFNNIWDAMILILHLQLDRDQENMNSLAYMTQAFFDVPTLIAENDRITAIRVSLSRKNIPAEVINDKIIGFLGNKTGGRKTRTKKLVFGKTKTKRI
jgi:hypothetical protein